MTRGVEDKNICFHCRKDKKKCVKKSDEDTACERCQHYKYECVPADSYGGTVPQPVFKKQPRCTQCRKDHKVCLPYERQPGQSCNRCSEKGLPCLAAVPNSSRASRQETPSRATFPDYPNTFPSAASTDGSYHHHRAFSEHGLQRRASLHSYSPHSPYYPGSGAGTPTTPTTPSSYYASPVDASRREFPPPSRYRPLAPAPHPSLPSSAYVTGPIPPYSHSHSMGMYPPTQTPISPTPSYMSLTPSSPPTSPQTARRSDMNSNDRIAEIMSINNLVDGEDRPRPSSN